MRGLLVDGRGGHVETEVQAEKRRAQSEVVPLVKSL